MNQLRDNLKTLGLSPNHIFQQVKDAISEDLAGGEDITSISTILKPKLVLPNLPLDQLVWLVGYM